MASFDYSPEIRARFPTTRGAVIEVTGIANGSSSPELRERFAAEQAAVIADLGDSPLAEIESVAAWRRTFSAFGVKPTQYRSAVEALLRRLTKAGDIPSINTMVDLANMVSIRNRLPVAVFDQASVTGATVVRFADGSEQFTDLGSDTISNPEAGEVIFADDANVVSARRWCWRQSRQSAAGPGTQHALITIEGQHDHAASDVEQAAKEMVALLAGYQPDAETSLRLLAAGGE